MSNPVEEAREDLAVAMQRLNAGNIAQARKWMKQANARLEEAIDGE